MKLTVGICTKDRDCKLRECLQALKKQSQYIDYLIVVEDISQQQYCSLEFLQKFFAHSQQIKVKYQAVKFCNIARSRTELINMVKDGVLVFVDDDVIVADNSLQKVGQFFSKHPAVSLLIGKVLPVNSTSPVSEVDYIYFSQGVLQFDQPHHIQICPFSFVGLNITQIKKQKTQLLRFDPQFLVGEDIDFSLRLFQAKQQLFFDPSILNYHHYDTSLFSFLLKKFTHGKYIYLLYQKHTQSYRDPTTLPIATSLFELPFFIWKQSWGATQYYLQIYQFSFLEKIVVFCGETATLLGMSIYKFSRK